MPTFDASKPEDVQRMQLDLEDVVEQLSDPRTGGNYGLLRALEDKYRQIAGALGIGTDQASMYKNAQAIKDGGDPTKIFAMPTSQGQAPGTAATTSIGSGQQQPVSRPGESADSAAKRASPYSYIVNPSAYQYGGEVGLAASEEARYGGLASAAASDAQKYAGQYQQGYDQSGQSRAQQQQGLDYLKGMAEGTGPSAANAQMMSGLAAARQSQASIAANARGGGAGLAAANQAAAQQGANISTQGIGQAATLRAQEQIGAMGQYGQLAGAMREGDFDQARLGASQQLASNAQQSQWENYMQSVRAQQSGYQQGAEQQNLAREGAIRGWELQQSQQQQAQQAQWINAVASSVSGLAGLAGAFKGGGAK